VPGQVAPRGRLDPTRTTGSTPAIGHPGAVPTHGQALPYQVQQHNPVTRGQEYDPTSGGYRYERPTNPTRTTGSHAALPIHAMGPYEEPPPPAGPPGSGADAGPPGLLGSAGPLGLPVASASAGAGGDSSGTNPSVGGPDSAGTGDSESVPSRAVASPPARPPTGATAGSLPPGQLVAGQMRRLSPEQVRTTGFTRSPLGRRGLAEDEVNTFVNRLAEELAARDSEIVRLLDENHRLKQAMREWQTERIDAPVSDAVERVNAETAVLMARAQQHIDAQIAQTELYCRQREQEAVRRYDDIVRHARQQVREEAEQVTQRYRETSGTTYSPDQEQLKRQEVYLSALLQSLDALGSHVQATRQAFAAEITRVTTGPADDDRAAIESSSSGD
jgi:DivIVA domain-containing protein